MSNTYALDELVTHRHFETLLQEVCHALGVRITWLSDAWIAQLAAPNATCYIEGYTFPLNNAVASAICRDKTATATVLAHNAIPALPNLLLRPAADTPIAKVSQQACALAPLPLVIKPNSESGGRDIYKCATAADVQVALERLLPRYRSLAVGPFVAITNEYRVVVLDGEPLLTFAKIRAHGEWRHNLKHGATPHMVRNPAVEALAVTALGAIGGRLAAVDVVETPDGLQVIEINGGIMLERFAGHSPAYKKEALRVYTAIVRASLLG